MFMSFFLSCETSLSLYTFISAPSADFRGAKEMRKIENRDLEGATSVKALSMQTLQSNETVIAQKSYHELADRPLVEVDVLTQLHANVAQLADLQARLNFVMREVRYLLKV